MVRDDQGHTVWRRPPFTATLAELIDAAEARLIDGDPLQPYLVLVIPQGELGALADWNLFTQQLKLLWEVSATAAQLGGSWGFFELVRKVMSRRSEKATEIVEGQCATWGERGARPGDLIELVRRRPQTGESFAALLGCTVPEAEAVLWAVGAGLTAGVDYELKEAGSIEGQVVSELDGTPLAGVEVCAYFQWEDHEPSCAVTDAAGRYLLVGLGAVGEEESDYRLQFFPEHSRLPYFRSYGGLVGFDEELDDLVQAEVVPVSKGHVTKVPDQELKPDAEVQDSVTAAFDGHP